MKNKHFLKCLVSIFFITGTAATAGLNGAWINSHEDPYGYPYCRGMVSAAAVEITFEDGGTFTGDVVLYDKGIYYVHENGSRMFVSLTGGLSIEKKDKGKILFTFPDGSTYLGNAISPVNGEVLIFRSRGSWPSFTYVFVFSDRYNFQRNNMRRVKYLKIFEAYNVAETPPTQDELFR